ncbi:MAG: hypothetical protein FJW56_07955 [Actinobacteria bacterium]|nr:hypothetical protein [Actinomycetota bacterium]
MHIKRKGSIKMRIKEIKVELLKDIFPKDFEPYGQIMGNEKGEPLEDFTYLRYWPTNVETGDKNEEIDIGLLICQRTEDKITKLERHKNTFEILFPFGGDTIWVLAPPDNNKKKPDLSRIRAFHLDGTLGICLHKGTWHWAPICLKETVKFMVLLKGGLEDPTEYQDINLELKLLI